MKWPKLAFAQKKIMDTRCFEVKLVKIVVCKHLILLIETVSKNQAFIDSLTGLYKFYLLALPLTF